MRLIKKFFSPTVSLTLFCKYDFIKLTFVCYYKILFYVIFKIMQKVCLIIGAGAGIGGNVAKLFGKNDYHVYLTRRSDENGLNNLINQVNSEGGKASGELLNAVKDETIENLIQKVENDVGPIDVAVYNLGAQIGNKSLENLTIKQFDLGFKMGTLGLFRLAKTLFPFMEKRKSGTLIVTSSTAAVRGNKGQHSHAAAMGARRMLCQTLNDEFSIKGIHIIHAIIDGAVDAPDTLGKMLGDGYEVKNFGAAGNQMMKGGW